MGTRAATLRKAMWITDLLEAIGAEPVSEDESEASLAEMWDTLLSWLLMNRQEWASQHIMATEMAKRPLSFTSLMGQMRAGGGGSYLRFRQMRTSAEGIRYVISDGSTDFAEVVANAESGVVTSIFPYRSQHLVHLIRPAVEHGVKITE